MALKKSNKTERVLNVLTKRIMADKPDPEDQGAGDEEIKVKQEPAGGNGGAAVSGEDHSQPKQDSGYPGGYPGGQSGGNPGEQSGEHEQNEPRDQRGQEHDKLPNQEQDQLVKQGDNPPSQEAAQPQQQSYDHPQQQSYNQPPQQNYNQLPQQSYNQPPQQSYNQPPQQNYNQPPQQSYNQPPQQNYNQPPQQSYNQPPQQQNYNQPPQQSYNQPPQYTTQQGYGQMPGSPIYNKPISDHIEYSPVLPSQNPENRPAARKSTEEVAELIRGNLELVNAFDPDGNQSGEDDEPEVVNIMLDIVAQKIPDFISKLGGCSCAKCRADALAYALNLLPARYVVTQKGRLLAHLSAAFIQSNTDISTAITRACIHVLNHPQH